MHQVGARNVGVSTHLQTGLLSWPDIEPMTALARKIRSGWQNVVNRNVVVASELKKGNSVMPKHDHPPSFPFYVDDFIADSAVDAMTNQELGIYIRLLCKAWKEDPVGTLPNDDQLLSRWAKESIAAWKKCRAGVLRAFRVEGDRLHQKRMKDVWQKVIEHREAKSRAGKKGMANRWQNNNTVNNTAITDGITKNNLPSPSSFSFSYKDGDVCKSILSGEEGERLLDRARRIQSRTKIDCRDPDDRKLIAKLAVLWELGDFSDEDIEHVLQSFGSATIKKRGAYLHKCMATRCELQHKDFNGLLARTTIPAVLLVPAIAGANA